MPMRRIFLTLAALIVLLPASAHAQDATAEKTTAEKTTAEEQLFSLFEKTCMAFAGDTGTLKAWTDLNMHSVAATDEDRMFKTFIGRWQTDIDGHSAALRVLDPPWSCAIFAENMNGPALQAKLADMNDKLGAGGHFKLRYEDETEPTHPEFVRKFLEVTLPGEDPLVLKFTTNPANGPARLEAIKTNNPFSQSPEAKKTTNQPAKTAQAQDDKPGIDKEKLAAALNEQLGVVVEYSADKDDITKKAVEMFEQACVENFDQWDNLVTWADANMTPVKDDPYAKARGDSPAGSWVEKIRDDVQVNLSFTNVPASCLVMTTRSFSAITHNEMKLMAGRLGKGGAYKTHYKGNIINPQTGTHYSMIILEPADKSTPLQILASTNTKMGEKSVFSIGYLKQ